MGQIEEFRGKTFVEINVSDDQKEVCFHTSCQKVYLMYHDQSCCEKVYLEEIVGDLNDLIGSEILVADEVSNRDDLPLSKEDDSYTWTFYHFRTQKGTVTFRWYGTSNGYYSEEVSIVEM